MSATRETIVVGGSVAQRPGRGGHAWVFLQYLLGLRRLGLDVLFVDRLQPGMGVEKEGRAWLVDVMEGFGLGDAYALLGDRPAGLPRREVVERARRSAFLLNVMGFLDDEEILAAAPLRVFLDIDPGFGQMWRELGLADPLAGHDVFVTIGENVGRPECEIPTCGLEWITTRQPVVLDEWPAVPPGRRGFTSVGAWRGPYDPIEYGGKTYGLRVHAFRALAPLPRLTGERFELALDIHPGEIRDLELLREHGWTLVDPLAATGDPWAYRRYLQESRGELMVAKHLYVETRSGWFSDRSACYLASGRPVLAHDSGLAGLYPTGEGLVTFSDLDGAVAGVERIAADKRRHARAARALAEELFDSALVLGRLLDRISAGPRA